VILLQERRDDGHEAAGRCSQNGIMVDPERNRAGEGG
jgi:hypothetical protein